MERKKGKIWHQIIGPFSILTSILLFFNLLEQIIGAQSRRIENQVHYNYSAADLEWAAIFWFYKFPILVFLVALIGGITLYKSKKIGWIMLVPTLIILVLSSLLLLMIPSYSEMTIIFDHKRLIVLFVGILVFAVLIIMVTPFFWRSLYLKRMHLLAALAWLILLLIANDFILSRFLVKGSKNDVFFLPINPGFLVPFLYTFERNAKRNDTDLGEINTTSSQQFIYL